MDFNLCYQFKELNTNVKDVFTIISKLEEKIAARVRRILRPLTLTCAVSMKVLIMNDIKKIVNIFKIKQTNKRKKVKNIRLS